MASPPINVIPTAVLLALALLEVVITTASRAHPRYRPLFNQGGHSDCCRVADNTKKNRSRWTL